MDLCNSNFRLIQIFLMDFEIRFKWTTLYYIIIAVRTGQLFFSSAQYSVIFHNYTLFAVDLHSLICENDIVPNQDDVNDPEIENAPAVCGTNGVTYPSLCNLLQDTGNEAVAYAGRCGQEECQGGLVC